MFYTLFVERLFRINSIEIDKSFVTATGNIMDGFQHGENAFFKEVWQPNLFSSQILVQIISGMSITELGAFRKSHKLSIEQALRSKSIGTFYSVDIYQQNKKFKVQKFNRNFGNVDPFQTKVKTLMKNLLLSTSDMKKICQREFLVENYQNLSLTDRKQLVEYLTFDFTGLEPESLES